MTALSERIAELERITRTMTPRDAVPILMAHIASEAERIARAVADERERLAKMLWQHMLTESQPRRMAYGIASSAIRRGRMLTDAEHRANLLKALDEMMTETDDVD